MHSVVVLDLDATLVNIFGDVRNWIEVNGECRDDQCKRLIDFRIPTGFLWGTKRPNIEVFLQSCFRNFDVVGVWSAGNYEYVHEIVREVFKSRSPDFIWTKEDCVTCYHEDDETYVKSKPLSKLWKHFPNFDRKRTLLIDDAPDVCAQNPLNHVLVPPWEGTWDTLFKDDNVLKILQTWFDTKIRTTDDLTIIPYPDLTSEVREFSN